MKHLSESINTGYWVRKNMENNGASINMNGLYIFWRAKIMVGDKFEWESGFAKDYLLLDRWTAKCIPWNSKELTDRLIDDFQDQNEDIIMQIVTQNHDALGEVSIDYTVLTGREMKGIKKYEITFNKCFGTRKGAGNALDFDWSKYKKYEIEGRKLMTDHKNEERKKWEESETRKRKADEEFKERIKLERTYSDAGYINGWTNDFPTDDIKQRVEKAGKEHEYFIRNLGRCDNEYVSDKYKVIWRVDSTD